MDALTALQTRVSSGLLDEPAPSEEQLEQLIRAALRAPDHGALRPWEFIALSGEALQRFGELCAQGHKAKKLDWTPAEVSDIKKKVLRAPMILVVVAKSQEHPKVPKVEQLLSAGAAATNIVTAAYVMGIGAMWRTGPSTYNTVVKRGLGLGEQDEIVGFIYLGAPKVAPKPAPELNPADYLRRW